MKPLNIVNVLCVEKEKFYAEFKLKPENNGQFFLSDRNFRKLKSKLCCVSFNLLKWCTFISFQHPNFKVRNISQGIVFQN